MKKIIALMISLVLCICLCSCYSTSKSNQNSEFSGLLPVVGYNCLYYDKNTKVVYIMFKECGGYDGYGYMSPYYAPNGFPYCYDANNQILIEIDGGGING